MSKVELTSANNLRFLCKCPRSCPPTCEEEEPVYGYKVEDGRRVFGIIGKKNVVEEINSYRDQTDFSIIMKSLNPDMSDFEQFGNLVDNVIPAIGSVQDMISYEQILKDEFAQLPLKVKNKYGNDYESFARSLIDGSFVDYVRSEYQPQQGVEGVADNGIAGNNGMEGNSDGNADGRTASNGSTFDKLNRELESLKQQIDATRKGGE